MSGQHSEPCCPAPYDACRSRRRNEPMVQSVLLIWLDSNINEKNTDCQHTLKQLRRAMNSIDVFNNGEECIRFLDELKDDKACMIISGSLGKSIVPRIHHKQSVDTIFIFCGNKELHKQWVKAWPKIKDVFTEIEPICDALVKTARQCERDATPVSLITTAGDMSKKSLNQMDPSFMYTQILTEILRTIPFQQHHVNEYVDYCREVFANNPTELTNIETFQRQRHEKSPVWWYTYDCFLYRMLNRCLRLMEVDVIIKMGFFINELHRDIDHIYRQQIVSQNYYTMFEVYRGQGMPKTDFANIQQSKGGLLSFNNFLSTSNKKDASMIFARMGADNPDNVGILFVMRVQPVQSSTAFAPIAHLSYFKDEDEVLFSMHAVFRINDIKLEDEKSRIYRVDLTVTNDKDKDLQVLTDLIRQEIPSDAPGWVRLGEILLKMSQVEKAEQVFQISLQQTPTEIAKIPIYRQLAVIKNIQGHTEEAIQLLEKVLGMQQQILPPNHPDVAITYNDIGSSYNHMGNYAMANSCYGKSLGICQQTLAPNHRNLAVAYGNFADIYVQIKNYPMALSYLEQAIAICQQSLPPNHPCLAGYYGAIGFVYNMMGNYPAALSYSEKALAIRIQSLPSDSPCVACSYGGTGDVYRNMGEYTKALAYLEKAREIREKAPSIKSSGLDASFREIAKLYCDMGDREKASSYLEKALAITEESNHPNHLCLAAVYSEFGLIYEKLRDLPKARSFLEKSVSIAKVAVQPDHPKLKEMKLDLKRVKNKS